MHYCLKFPTECWNSKSLKCTVHTIITWHHITLNFVPNGTQLTNNMLCSSVQQHHQTREHSIHPLAFMAREKDYSPTVTSTDKVVSITCRSRSNWARSACIFTSSLNLASSVNCNSSSSSSFWAFCSASWLSSARFAFSSSWTCRNRR